MSGIDIGVPPFALGLALLGALGVVAFFSAGLLTTALNRALVEPRSDGHDLRVLRLPLALSVALACALALASELGLPEALVPDVSRKLVVLLILSCAVLLARLAVIGVTEYAARHPAVLPALGVARVAVRALAALCAVVAVLQTLGVPIAPLVTTLGIGSLGVALAMQDTVVNFLAGLYVLADRPVRVGDYIKIHDGEQGQVETIGWRSTRLRTLQGNIVVVPNQKLAQATVTNYHLPSPDMALTIQVPVPYEIDPEIVEATLIDELQLAAAEIEEVTAAPASCRLAAFEESSLRFDCTIFVRDYESQFRAATELRKRLLLRLRQEGIEMPYPQRVVRSPDAAERRKNQR